MSANPKLHKPIPARKIQGFVHTEIQGVPVPNGVTGLSAEQVKDFAIVATPIEPSEENGYITLVQISPDHGRSYEVYLPNMGSYYWKDQYGNLFSSLSVKGNNLSKPHIFAQAAAPGGFAVWGMQESDSMVRVLKASQLLRAHHIDTEMIVGVLEPAELPKDEKMLPVSEFKRELIKDLFNRVREAKNKKDKDEIWFKAEEIAPINLHLEKQIFLFTIRGMQVTERISDLRHCTTEEEFRSIMTQTFGFVNQAERDRAMKDPEYRPSFFNAEDDVSIEAYFMDHLPKRAAINFAALHNLGLSHGYPHAGNISLVGSLYDLDSIRGKLIEAEDDERGQEGRMNMDIFFFLYGHEVFRGRVSTFISSMGVRDIFESLEENGILKREDNASYSTRSYEFAQVFLQHYTRERGWEKDLMQHLPKIEAFSLSFDYPNDEVYRQSLEYYSDLLSKQTGLQYGNLEDQLRTATQFVQLTDQEGADNLKIVLERNPNDKKFASLARKFKRLHNSKSNNQKRRERLQSVIEDDLREQRANELEDLTSRYSKEAADSLVSMMTISQIDLVDVIANESKLDRWSFNNLRRRIITAIGWEEDLLSHINDIVRIFEMFLGPGDEEFYDYYFSKLASQVGWSYVHAESVNELIEKFHQEDQERVDEIIKKELSQTGSDVNIQDEIEKALEKDRQGVSTLELLDEFVIDHVVNTMNQVQQAELQELISQYGEEKILYLAGFYLIKTETQVFKYFTPEKLEELEERRKQRIDTLKEEFSGMAT